MHGDAGLDSLVIDKHPICRLIVSERAQHLFTRKLDSSKIESLCYNEVLPGSRQDIQRVAHDSAMQ